MGRSLNGQHLLNSPDVCVVQNAYANDCLNSGLELVDIGTLRCKAVQFWREGR